MCLIIVTMVMELPNNMLHMVFWILPTTVWFELGPVTDTVGQEISLT